MTYEEFENGLRNVRAGHQISDWTGRVLHGLGFIQGSYRDAAGYTLTASGRERLNEIDRDRAVSETSARAFAAAIDSLSRDGYHTRGTTERRHHVSREPLDGTEERIDVDDALRLHIFQDDVVGGEGGEWVVWLNTEVSDFDGLVLAIGTSRDDARAQAVAVAEAIESALQRPAMAICPHHGNSEVMHPIGEPCEFCAGKG